jgi:hypothetical protein
METAMTRLTFDPRKAFITTTTPSPDFMPELLQEPGHQSPN